MALTSGFLVKVSGSPYDGRQEMEDAGRADDFLHIHNNLSVLNLIQSAGSRNIITISERNQIITNSIHSTTIGNPHGTVAIDIPYDNVESGLLSTNIQNAINEVHFRASISVVYKGTWDASTGNPPSADPHQGDYYVVSVGGFWDGKNWLLSDWAVYNGLNWDKIAASDEYSHIHANLAILNLIQSVGSGHIITNEERANIGYNNDHRNSIGNPHDTLINDLNDVDTQYLSHKSILSYDFISASWMSNSLKIDGGVF